MIKRIATPSREGDVAGEWLDLAAGVEVDLTTEDPAYPIEGALLLDRSKGWRATAPGPQSITLLWSDPIRVRRMRFVFEEQVQHRTQEFVVRALSAHGMRDVVRQQFTFSPGSTTIEREEYDVNLEGVTRLELAITPAIDHGDAIASLKEWRIK